MSSEPMTPEERAVSRIMQFPAQIALAHPDVVRAGLHDVIGTAITKAVAAERDRILLDVSRVRHAGMRNAITNDYLHGWHAACDYIRDAITGRNQ